MTIGPASSREWLTVPEWRRRHPYLGKNKVYTAVGDGTLKSIRIGGKILVASDALDVLAADRLDYPIGKEVE